MALTMLGRLRRFARVVEADPEEGDDLVRRLLNNERPPWLYDEGTFSDRSREFSNILAFFDFEGEHISIISHAADEPEMRGIEEIGDLSSGERALFALRHIEQFSPSECAVATRWTDETYNEIEEEMEREAFAFRRRVLIIEPDEEKLDAIDSVLAELRVTSIRAKNASDVVKRNLHIGADLIIARGSQPGIAPALVHMLNQSAARSIDLENYLSRFDPRVSRSGSEIVIFGIEQEPTMMNSGDLRTQVRDLLYVAPHRWVPADETFEPFYDPALDLEIEDGALEPSLAPIDAEVVEEQLRLAPTEAPASAVPFSALDALRRQHLRNAQAQVDHARSSNVAPRVKDHLDALVALLDQPLTEEMLLGLSVGVDAMSRLLPIIEEELTRLAAADIAGFLLDLQRYTNQFPISRTFNGEASAGRPIAPDEDDALRKVESAIVAQDDAVVAPELKAQLALLGRARAWQAGSSISDVAWVRSISNTLKAVARHIKALGDDLYGEARGTAVKQMGKLIGSLPTAGALYLLATNFPVEFAALTLILQRSKEQIGKMVGKDDD